MAWVVDTSVLLDIHLDDPAFGRSSAECLARQLGDGLVLCPVSFIELSPAFAGDGALQQRFLQEAGVNWLEPWIWQDPQARPSVLGAPHGEEEERRIEEAPRRGSLHRGIFRAFSRPHHAEPKRLPLRADPSPHVSDIRPHSVRYVACPVPLLRETLRRLAASVDWARVDEILARVPDLAPFPGDEK